MGNLTSEKCLQTSGRSKCAQTYTRHADCDGSSEETYVHAALVALLPDKKRYDRIFRLTLDLVPEWNLQQMNLDFEASTVYHLSERVFQSRNQWLLLPL